MIRVVCLLVSSLICVSQMPGIAVGQDAEGDVGADVRQVDVLIFGGTPAGIAAAIAAASDGCSVLLMEPASQIGGMVTSGLSHTDFHSRESLSGSFLDFAGRVEKTYADQYGPESQQVIDSFGGTFAEPHVNLATFQQMLQEHPAITVVHQQNLQSVQMDDRLIGAQQAHGHRRIHGVTFADRQGDLKSIECQMVIDASYEGDLMAMAQVEWHCGREGRSQYGESLAPETADQQLQAYNFRFVMTTVPENRVAVSAPKGYQRNDFVGVLDALQSGEIKSVFGYPSHCIFKAHLPPLPNGKYDINDVSRNLVRLSLPGRNTGWPDGTAQERQAIFEDHLRDQAGLLYFLQTDDAVPEVFQQEALRWGWCRDEFQENQHLPPQLYVREARRMVGQHVYVQGDSEHAPGDARAVWHPDSIAMADYGNNCHGTAHEGPRFGGKHTGEFYNPVPPYQIPYGVLVPRDVQNLLVPGAVSSSHVGFCALRLEPIWMSLGQAAGHAAAQAVTRGTSVQNVAVRQLQSRLHAAGSASIYVSDVLPGHPDFAAVQWWGNQGGLHGLAPMPEKPGQRGKKLHGQYCEATPGHAVELHLPLDAALFQRWTSVAKLAGLQNDQLPAASNDLTRGEFLRQAFASAQSQGLTESTVEIPRQNPAALQNTHPPGEVDNAQLIDRVVVDAATLGGIVVDDADAVLVGEWQYSSHTPPYVGRGYLHDRNEKKGEKSVTYVPTVPHDGHYEVRLSHCCNIRRSTNTLITVQHADGQVDLRIDQQQVPEHAELFRTIGRYRFLAGREGWIRISNTGTDGKYVIADAVQLIPLP